MPNKRPLPPIWLMGLGNVPVGLSGAVMLVTVPQLLAAKGVPEPAVAWVTATALIATFTNFLLAPILDWRLTRRAYAILFALLTGALSTAALLAIDNPPAVAALGLAALLAANLNQAAVGGWLSTVTRPEAKGVLGAWLSAANVGAFGAGAAVAIRAVRGLPSPAGAVAVGLLELLPLPLYLWIPATPPDARLAHESFGAFLRDVLLLLRRPIVRWLLLLFAMPAAAFALSNTLTGLGKDFDASEDFVGIVAGVGVTVAGVVGCVLVPPLLRFVAPERLYLSIGAGGALLTLAQLAAPRIPASFAFGMIEQNGVQAAAFSVVNVLILRSNGENNPLAATQFALLSAAIGLPLSYMQALDGQAYGMGGLGASYLADASVSLAACAILGWLLSRRNRAPVPALALQAEQA